MWGRRFLLPTSAPSEFSRDYALGEELGKGNFATVFVATAVRGEGRRSRSEEEDVAEGESRDAPWRYAVKRIEKKGMDDRDKEDVLLEVGVPDGGGWSS